MSETHDQNQKRQTRFAHIARPKAGLGTAVNPSIDRASTLLFDRAEDLYRSDIRGYGRHGSQVHDNLKEAFCELEGGAGASLTSSGLSACTLAIQSVVKAGDHILLTDSAYGPVRSFCLNYLKSMGVETEIYDPHIGSDIKTLIRENTSLIWLESPGSLTFEIQDLPAISKAAKSAGVITAIDNTWSAGITLQPFAYGIDLSIHAATKYFGGHSDLLAGAVICRTKSLAAKVAKTRKFIGHSLSADDAYQVLRGFRTVIPRFRHAEQSALKLAHWLDAHDGIDAVLHPELPSHPDHQIWARDFTGGACIFSFTLKGKSESDAVDFINALNIFGIGYSYGGFESLAIHCGPQLKRNHKSVKLNGPLIRFACGIEDPQDLINDVKQALNAIS